MTIRPPPPHPTIMLMRTRMTKVSRNRNYLKRNRTDCWNTSAAVFRTMSPFSFWVTCTMPVGPCKYARMLRIRVPRCSRTTTIPPKSFTTPMPGPDRGFGRPWNGSLPLPNDNNPSGGNNETGTMMMMRGAAHHPPSTSSQLLVVG